MIVTPYREDPFLSLHSFDEFFATVQDAVNAALHSSQAIAKPGAKPAGTARVSGITSDTPTGIAQVAQVVNLAVPLYGIDPLRALETIATPDQEQFYWENGHTGEAIAAIDSVAQVHLSGSDRLSDAKQFIYQCLQNTITIGDRDCPLTGVRFFCRFTFFDEVSAQTPFAPASVNLPRWQIASQGEFGSFVANIPLTSNTNLRAACTQIWSLLGRIGVRVGGLHSSTLSDSTRLGSRPGSVARTRNGSDAHLRHRQEIKLPQISQPEQQQFQESVREVLRAVEAHDLRKVVLAHKLDVSLPAPLSAPKTLHMLRRLHTDCHLFATQTPQGQTFLGASPERLLTIRNGQLTTEAIAGSAPRGKTPPEDARFANALLSSLKELHEHQLVVEFISQQLEELGLTTQRSPFPYLLQLSNIQHLQTPISATVPPDLHPLDLVAALHPTPAVAGVPRQLACDYIRRYERFERSLYAAPLGWVDDQGNSEFIVGIRSALLDGFQARLYAGAGIVRGSNPAREMAEIELKFRALYSALIQGHD